MRVLIISDSHGKNDDVKNVIKQAGPIDMLIHLGDIERGPEYISSLVQCPVYLISGNNDYDIHLPNSARRAARQQPFCRPPSVRK